MGRCSQRVTKLETANFSHPFYGTPLWYHIHYIWIAVNSATNDKNNLNLIIKWVFILISEQNLILFSSLYFRSVIIKCNEYVNMSLTKVSYLSKIPAIILKYSALSVVSLHCQTDTQWSWSSSSWIEGQEGRALQRWGRGHQRGPIQETTDHLPYDRTQVIQAIWTQR